MRTTLQTNDQTRALVMLITFEPGDVIATGYDGIAGAARRWTRRAAEAIRVEVEIPVRQIEYLAERAIHNASRKAQAGGMTARVTSAKRYATTTTYNDDGSERIKP